MKRITYTTKRLLLGMMVGLIVSAGVAVLILPLSSYAEQNTVRQNVFMAGSIQAQLQELRARLEAIQNLFLSLRNNSSLQTDANQSEAPQVEIFSIETAEAEYVQARDLLEEHRSQLVRESFSEFQAFQVEVDEAINTVRIHAAQNDAAKARAAQMTLRSLIADIEGAVQAVMSTQDQVVTIETQFTPSRNLERERERLDKIIERIEGTTEWSSQNIKADAYALVDSASESLRQAERIERQGSQAIARSYITEAAASIYNIERILNESGFQVQRFASWIPPVELSEQQASVESLMYQIELFREGLTNIEWRNVQENIQSARSQIAVLSRAYFDENTTQVSRTTRDVSMKENELRNLLEGISAYQALSSSARTSLTSFAQLVGQYRTVRDNLSVTDEVLAERNILAFEDSFRAVQRLNAELQLITDELQAATDSDEVVILRERRLVIQTNLNEAAASLNNAQENFIRTVSREVGEYFSQTCFFTGTTNVLDFENDSGEQFEVSLLQGASFRCVSNQVRVEQTQITTGAECLVLSTLSFPNGTVARVQADRNIEIEGGFIPAGNNVFECVEGVISPIINR